jgi:hypothetical protein
MRLELFHDLMRIVDERESSALSSTVLCPEAEAGDLVFVNFVEFSEFLAELVLGDVGAVGMEDIAIGDGISKGPSDANSLLASRWRQDNTHTTICFRPRREFRMNLRVRSVTGCSRSAIFADYGILSV